MTAPGASAMAAVEKRLTAYKEESTPGSAITNLAAAKLEAQRTHSTMMIPRYAKGSTQVGRENADDCASPASISVGVMSVMPTSSRTTGSSVSLLELNRAATLFFDTCEGIATAAGRVRDTGGEEKAEAPPAIRASAIYLVNILILCGSCVDLVKDKIAFMMIMT